jgi:hypothetical protein
MARLIERAPASEILSAKRLQKCGLIDKTAHQIIFEGGECGTSVARSGHWKGIAKTRGAVNFHRIGRHAPSPGSLQLNAGRHDRNPWSRIMADGFRASNRIHSGVEDKTFLISVSSLVRALILTENLFPLRVAEN